jgi:hypothetical protein
MLRIPRLGFSDGFTSKRGEELYKLLNSCKISPADLAFVSAEIDTLVERERKKKSYIRNVLHGKHEED